MMKKIIITLTLVVLTAVSCSKDDSNEISNPFKGTGWIADDYIASLLYGSGCTMTIEFLDDSKCQEIKYVPRGVFAGTRVEEGTYTFDDKTVTWKIKDHTRTATMSGSILTSTLVINNKNVIYTKK